MLDISLTTAQLLAWGIVLIPLIGAVVACCQSKSSGNSFQATIISSSLLSFLSVLYLYPLVFKQGTIVQTNFEILLTGLRLKVDPLGLFFAFFTSMIWLLASIYNGPYFHPNKKRHHHTGITKRYASIWLLTLSGNLGLVLAEDLFSFFIFFEILSLSAFFLIIHNEDKAAWKAGVKYLCTSLGGGILLLWGILLCFSYSNSLQWTAIWQAKASTSPTGWILAFVLILIGLGVKAGVMPLHVWLPDAHPAAPTPASALLSGVMIKAGAYGMIRLAQGYIQIGSNSHWAVSGTQVGYGLLAAGLISMLFGVTMALLQHNAKRLLAYHSISQMGYIIFGIGMCLYLGSADALLAGLYHVLNHALFKSALFLIAGVIYWQTAELDLQRLGGWSKLLPLLFVCSLIASAGISGLPPFNGYISKTLLHVNLTEGLVHTAPNFAGEAKFIDVLFIITGVGTLVSFIKFVYFIFIISPTEKQVTPQPTPWAMQTPIIVLSALILLVGIFPHFWLENLLVPALGLKKHLHILGEIHFWAMHELSGAGITVLLGSIIFSIAIYSDFFYKHWPALPFVDRAYRLFGTLCLFSINQAGVISVNLQAVNQRLGEKTWTYYQQAINKYENFKASNIRCAEKAGSCFMHVMGEYNKEMQNLPHQVETLVNKFHEVEAMASGYCHHVGEEVENKLIHLAQDKESVREWAHETGRELILREFFISDTLVKLSEFFSDLKQKARGWIIKKGERYQPLGNTEELTPADSIRYFIQFCNRDLSFGLLLILLVLLLFLFSQPL